MVFVSSKSSGEWLRYAMDSVLQFPVKMSVRVAHVFHHEMDSASPLQGYQRHLTFVFLLFLTTSIRCFSFQIIVTTDSAEVAGEDSVEQHKTTAVITCCDVINVPKHSRGICLASGVLDSLCTRRPWKCSMRQSNLHDHQPSSREESRRLRLSLREYHGPRVFRVSLSERRFLKGTSEAQHEHHEFHVLLPNLVASILYERCHIQHCCFIQRVRTRIGSCRIEKTCRHIAHVSRVTSIVVAQLPVFTLTTIRVCCWPKHTICLVLETRSIVSTIRIEKLKRCLIKRRI